MKKLFLVLLVKFAPKVDLLAQHYFGPDSSRHFNALALKESDYTFEGNLLKLHGDIEMRKLLAENIEVFSLKLSERTCDVIAARTLERRDGYFRQAMSEKRFKKNKIQQWEIMTSWNYLIKEVYSRCRATIGKEIDGTGFCRLIKNKFPDTACN